jgi:hypothetical protein
LGPYDHIVTRPKAQRPDWMSPAEYAKVSKEPKLREIRIRIKDPGKRTRAIVIGDGNQDAICIDGSPPFWQRI